MRTCADCGKPFKMGERTATTFTGRVVHERCNDDLLAASAGAVANRQAPIAGAIATRGWLRRLHRTRPERDT